MGQLATIKMVLMKALLMIVDAPWYVPNTLIRRDYKSLQSRKK
jgi:hypothetical protein